MLKKYCCIRRFEYCTNFTVLYIIVFPTHCIINETKDVCLGIFFSVKILNPSNKQHVPQYCVQEKSQWNLLLSLEVHIIQINLINVKKVGRGGGAFYHLCFYWRRNCSYLITGNFENFKLILENVYVSFIYHWMAQYTSLTLKLLILKLSVILKSNWSPVTLFM